MKSIAIIGAGPAGLVAAKTLLHCYPEDTFAVSIFEQKKSIGGLWAVESNPNGMINPDMNTNLSQFTVCFSDLAWESISLKPAPNIYPKAWQVNRYLEHYAQKFIPDGTIAFQTRVKAVEQVVSDGKLQWRITTVGLGDKDPEEKVAVFDNLIIASGLHGKPQPINFELPLAISISHEVQIPLLHSSQYRTLGDLCTTEHQASSGKILIVGGSHSGAEVAAAIALQMSDACFSPSTSGIEPREIVHAMPYPIVSIPPFVQTENKSMPTFLPLDALLYELSSRSDDPVCLKFAHTTKKDTKELKDLLAVLMDGKKDAKDNDSGNEESLDSVSPYAVVGESYVEFVRSGAIRPVLGRVIRIERQENSDLLCAVMEKGSEEVQINDVAAVVNAGGFSSAPALEFMDKSIKDSVGYDASYPRLPFLLSRNCSTATESSPDNLALMGFDYGSYWGVLETQARVIASKWAQSSDVEEVSTSAFATSGMKEEEKKLYTFMKELRALMKDDPSSVSQNFLGDYPGLMEETFRNLGLQRIDLKWGAKEGMVTPARYINLGDDRVEAEKTMEKLQKTLDISSNGRAFAARATFRALQGNWKINSAGSSQTAAFHPRCPTDQSSDLEYLFIPKAPQDPYVSNLIFRLRETENVIEVWDMNYEVKFAAIGKRKHVLEFANATSNAQKDCLSVAVRSREDPDLNADDRDKGQTTVYMFYFSGIHVTRFIMESYLDDQLLDRCSSLEFTR